VNTLDLPALEFALTKRPLGRSAGVSVRSFLGFDFRDSWPEEPVPSRPPHPLGGARAVALMALNEPAGILLVREALREQRFPDPTWSALVPGLLRHARRMDRPESALGWADLLLEQDRPDAADLTLQAWMDLVPPDSGGRFRRGLEYALWLRARLAQRGGQAFPEALREPYLGALRAARFPYLEAAGHDEVRRAWDALVRAALLRDWAAVPRAAEAVQALSGTLAAADATDLRRLAWLLEAAAARARGQAEVAMDRLERIAGLHPLDPLPRIELLRALPPGSPAHDAHTRFLARLGPSPGVNRPLHRLLALVDPAGGSARPGEAERF
jgi:hypothetical protein